MNTTSTVDEDFEYRKSLLGMSLYPLSKVGNGNRVKVKQSDPLPLFCESDRIWYDINDENVRNGYFDSSGENADE